MSHLFEAFVDILEYDSSLNIAPHIFTERYEVTASSKQAAGQEALHKAETVHPAAAELDVRVTRIMDY
jgi:hypothetical protein